MKTTDRIAERCRQRADEVDDDASFLLRRAASIVEHQSEQIDYFTSRAHKHSGVGLMACDSCGEIVDGEEAPTPCPGCGFPDPTYSGIRPGQRLARSRPEGPQ